MTSEARIIGRNDPRDDGNDYLEKLLGPKDGLVLQY